MSCLTESLLDSARVARLLGVEAETLGAWRRRGYGPRWYRIGKKVKYTERDVNIWMEAQAHFSITDPGAVREEERSL